MARTKTSGPGLTYASAGVDINEKDRFTDSLEATMRRTFGPRVIQNPGGFAGLFRLDFNERLFARNYRDPVLVACCDGVGTKVKLAAEMGIYNTVGIDLVAMNVNDLVVQGAEPLFFLDYIAVPKVDRDVLTHLVEGIAEGCRQAACALLGGETANMPDVYAPGDFDLAGFCVGVVELKRAIKPNWVQPGDVILGLASAGIHSNGYSLVRRVVKEAKLELGRVYEELADTPGPSRRRSRAKPATARASRGSARPIEGPGPDGGEAAPPPNKPGLAREKTLGEVLLTPTRIYAGSIVRLMRSYRVKNVVTGMAHITGSGLAENLVRAIPPGCDAVIDRSSWEVPAVFRFIQQQGRIEEEEMRRVFNLGIGYCVVVKPAFADSVHEQLERLGERVFRIGKVVKGKGQVREA
ncbi:MAG: phosphoribosylformylglycinamidine cyclo-ligase [Phycisphaerales bacterium]|nr:phosphoribosylformylglycinamidine cyclo-ligase [Phycisphaerales bacterium]